MDETFEMLRSERRSFFCPNKLWKEIKVQTEDCISITTYIKLAILEKMVRDYPEREEYFKELLIL